MSQELEADAVDSEAQHYPIVLERAQIEAYLPHRGDILFPQRVRVLDADRYEGEVCWQASHPAIAGHFPGCPIVPGVFMIEAAAQIAGVGMLAGNPMARRSKPGSLGVLATVRRCDFRSVVQAGDTVRIEVGGKPMPGGLCQVSARAHVDARLAATIDLILARVPLASLARQLPMEDLVRANAGVFGFAPLVI